MSKTIIKNENCKGNQTYAVSENTARFLDCHRKCNSLYDDIYEAIEAIYGNREAERVMEEHVADHLEGIKSIVTQYAGHSINEELGSLNNVNEEGKILI